MSVSVDDARQALVAAMHLCSGCKEYKPADQFYYRTGANGKRRVDSKCRPCIRKRHAAYLKDHPEVVAKKKKASDKHRKKPAYVHYRAIYDKTHKERVLATARLSQAVKRGKIVRGPCECCEETKTFGWFEDYSNNYSVRWFCSKHRSLLWDAGYESGQPVDTTVLLK